ncbi:MAG: hypothetical protein ACQEV0_08440 [Bacillota bacterium]
MNEINMNIIAQYGLEVAISKANGSPSDPILKEVERREERWKKIQAYKRDVQLIQSKLKKVENKREREVLHWFLQGKSMR